MTSEDVDAIYAASTALRKKVSRPRSANFNAIEGGNNLKKRM